MKLTALLAPLALVAVEDAPRFAPAEGASLQKTFHEVTTLSLDFVLMSVNGEQQDAGELEMELVHDRQLTVTDTYARVADGRVAHLAREFDSVAAALEGTVNDGDEESIESQGEGELTGHTVDYKWDASAGAYVATFAEDDDGDVALLEGLEQDMDLLGFLPPAGSEVGATYEIELTHLQRLVRPGALGAIQFEDPGEDTDKEGVLFLSMLSARDAADEIEGEVQARWIGSEERDGRSLAKIELEVDAVLMSDLADKLVEMAEGIGVEIQELALFSEVSVEVALAGEGVLLWDLAAKRVAALELSLENETTLRFGGEEDMGGGSMTMDAELTFLGTTEITVETR